jgi:hypothetical protein
MSVSALSDEKYEQLKRFIGLFYDWYMSQPHLSSAVHPLKVMNDLEEQSAAKAKRGLGMAVNDCVEMSSGWNPEQVAEADARFLQHGALSLSEVRRTYSRKYLQILKRGFIKSLQEYYLVKGIVDGGGLEAGAGELQQLNAMLASFEQRLSSVSEA